VGPRLGAWLALRYLAYPARVPTPSPAAETAAHRDATRAPPAGAVRTVLLSTFRRIVRIYFRDIEATGNVPRAATGGRMFLGNHTNGIVDPILVLTSAPCPISPIAKSTLWKIPGLRWLLDAGGAVPILRRRDDPNKQVGENDGVFDRIASALAGGHNILIFPEGTSHNEPHLIEVKSGAARMLARAKEGGAAGLTFQAVALEFDARDHFRSRCLLVYGPVRAVDDLAAEGEALVAAITERFRDDLSELLVEGATWPERVLIARVAEMLANDAGDRSLERWNSIGRQVEAARKALGGVDEATVAAIGAAVDRYYALLAAEGLADEQLAAGDPPDEARLGKTIALGLSLPLAMVGTAAYAVPYQLTRLLTRRTANDPDEVSTYKLGMGLVLYPLWLGGLVTTSFLVAPPPWSFALAGLAVASPFAALAWHDASPGVRRALRFARHADRLAELRRARAEAMALIAATRERLGM
jgi:glycerol-3-phosphate O-acyltransferase / dihydroxyacetone phosphate acyltransferase